MALGEAERPTRKSRGENDLKAANHGNSKRDLVERTELGDCLDNAVVFFDLEDKMHVPKWTNAFLDRNVTHYITDKASRIAAQYNRSLQWGFGIWRLEKFVECLSGHLERRGFKTGSLSPVLKGGRKKRDLQQYLQEEDQSRLKNRVKAPTVTTTTTTAMAAPTILAAQKKEEDNLLEWRESQHPVVIIEDSEFRYAPIIKEYESDNEGAIKYPIFFWNSHSGHCPFVMPKDPVHPINRPLFIQCLRPAKCTTSSMVTRSRAQKTQPTQVVVHKVAKKIQWAATSGKPRPGFCECCWERYSDLDKHIGVFYHRQYAGEPGNYEKLDALLNNACKRECKSTGECVMNAAPISPEKSSNSLMKNGSADKENGRQDAVCSISRGYTASKRRKLQSLTLFQTGDSTPAFPEDSQQKVSLLLSAAKNSPTVAIPSSPTKRLRTRRQDLPVNRRLFVI